MRRPVTLLCLLALPACAEDSAQHGTPQRAVTLRFVGAPATAPGGTTLADLALEAHWEDGSPAGGVAVTLSVNGGGGSVAPRALTTDATGTGHLAWTLGALPIVNTLTAYPQDGAEVSARLTVAPAAALSGQPQGVVAQYLDQIGATGSTEDLAFAPDGALTMAYGGDSAGLFQLHPDASVTALTTTGTALRHPLGLAYDQAGVLYVADADLKALVKVSGHAASVLADHDGAEAFASPNDVAVARDGTVYVSDTCTGKVYAVDPGTGAITARVAFDAVTEGGPNGLVVGPDGALWVTTENTAIFCSNGDVELTAPIAGLFRVPLTSPGAMGPKETIQAGVGVFGDGLAFDGEGNLLVIFDTVNGVALDESIVFVRPAAGGPLVRALAARGKVYANIAFGNGAFGPKAIYLALLQIALVPNSPRGVERVEVGVLGSPLPPPR